MSNKLSLLVNFIGVDRMSGAMRSIVGLGRSGSQSLRALGGEARRIQREMREVSRSMSRASGNVSDLVNRERELERALEGVNRQIERQRRIGTINADRDAMRNRGADLRARGAQNVGSGAALAAPLIFATKAAADFSSGMVDIQQKANLTDQATDQLGARLISLAADARQMPEAMRSGLDALLAKGLGVEAATTMIAPIGRFATAYKVEIPDAANAGYASLNNLKVAAKDTARIFDVMAQAGNDGSFEIADMARNFPSLTAQLQALGDQGLPAVADLSAALQVAMNTAGNADEAGNNIANLLGKINAPGTISAFKKNFGVDLPAAMKKLKDQGYSSLEAIALVTKEATKGDLKKLGFAFEDSQARSGILAMIQNLEQYRQIRDRAGKAGGLVDRQFDQRVVRDATVQWRAFMGTASALALTLGTTLLPVGTQVLGNIQRVGASFGHWAQQNPALAGALMKTVAALVALRICLGVAEFAFGGLLRPAASVIAFFRRVDALSRFVKLLGFLRVATSGAAGVFVHSLGLMRVAAIFLARGVMQAGLMMMANPIALAIAAIVLAVGGAVYLIVRNWTAIKTAFVAGTTAVRGTLSALPAWLSATGSAMMQGLISALNPNLLVARLLSIAKAGITAFKGFFGIKSPSRLMMQMGGFMTSGLAVGLDRGRGAARRSMDLLVADVSRAGNDGAKRVRGAGMMVKNGATPVAQARRPEIAPDIGPGALALNRRLPVAAQVSPVEAPPASVAALRDPRAPKSPILQLAPAQLGFAVFANLIDALSRSAAADDRAGGAMASNPPVDRPVRSGIAERLRAPVEMRPAARRGAEPERVTEKITVPVYAAPGHSADEIAEQVMRKIKDARRSEGRRSYDGDR